MVVLQYIKTLKDFGVPNGSIRIQQSIDLAPNRSYYVKCVSSMISSSICNIYNVPGDINNGLIRVSPNGGANWISVQLPNGTYDLTMIQNALNAALANAGFWINNNDPGFTFAVNTSVQRVFINIDSSKLATPGQLMIDFSHFGSLMYQVLGYINNPISTADGLFEGDSIPRLDWFGSEVSVKLEGFGPLGISSGQFTQEICLIPLKNDGNTVPPAYFYPINGIIPPSCTLAMAGTISQFDVALTTIDNRQVYLNGGEFRLTFVLEEYRD